MINSFIRYSGLMLCGMILSFTLNSCKHKRKTQKSETAPLVVEDTIVGKCRLDYKSAKTLSRNVKENEFNFEWINAKANVESLVEDREEQFDIKVAIRKDSAMLVSIHYLLGLQ